MVGSERLPTAGVIDIGRTERNPGNKELSASPVEIHPKGCAGLIRGGENAAISGPEIALPDRPVRQRPSEEGPVADSDSLGMESRWERNHIGKRRSGTSHRRHR